MMKSTQGDGFMASAYIEKINIYIPKDLDDRIRDDALRFEILKPDGIQINRNRLLCLVIGGYYSEFQDERRKKLTQIKKALLPYLSGSELNEAAENVLGKTLYQAAGKKKGHTSVRFSFKPSREIEDIVKVIRETEESGASGCLVRMLTGYFEKPAHEREKILFRGEFDALSSACTENHPVTFLLRTTGNVHQVLPYAVLPGKNENYNYLLCQEIMEQNGVKTAMAMSYRLTRISNVRPCDSPVTFRKSVLSHFEKMKEKGPQYAINQDEVIKVKMTEKGIDLYRRIYLDRPLFDDKTAPADGVYTFSCSEEQAFFYFRKFPGDTAVIVSPDNLRQRMLDFHEKAAEALS